jgi:hypothetical protein
LTERVVERLGWVVLSVLLLVAGCFVLYLAVVWRWVDCHAESSSPCSSAAAFVVTAGVIANTRNELVAGSMVLAGPAASLMVIALLEAVADPTPGCAYECVGRLLLLAPAGGTFIGWGLGLVSGLVWRARRERPRLD